MRDVHEQLTPSATQICSCSHLLLSHIDIKVPSRWQPAKTPQGLNTEWLVKQDPNTAGLEAVFDIHQPSPPALSLDPPHLQATLWLT